MVKRSTPRRNLDDRAFPVRIAIAQMDGPEWLIWRDVEIWLRENVGLGEYAQHGLDKHSPYAMGFYFRTVEPAAALLDAFPRLQLADTTDRLDHLRRAREHVRKDSDRIFFNPVAGAPFGPWKV
jgi:hypothetical protein